MDRQDKSVLVTGGRGFIGWSVAKLLQRGGYGVVSLDASLPASPSANRREVECDLTHASQLQRVFEMEQIGGIIHLAAILPTAAAREPVQATQVNIQGSLHLLEMARRFGVRRVVFGSSLSVYGTCPADEVVSERNRAAPQDLYAAGKLYAEQLGEAYRQSYGLEFISLRIGRVVGPGAHSTSSAWRSRIFELLASRDAAEIALPYVGSEKLLLAHVDDVAKMLVSLLQTASPAHSVYNAACESVGVFDLKQELESLNSKLRVTIGKDYALGNPRLLDSSRLRQELHFQTLPIFEQLHKAAGK
jgi:nucleoside-diphosphate-sugar epimerase